MDQPGLEEDRHRHALRGLARLNGFSGSARVLWPPLRALAQKRPVRFLDLATGGGDVPLGLWRRAARAKLPLHIAGCDLSACAVSYSQEQARRWGAEVHFFQLDALRGPLPPGYNVIACSLFLHHLDEAQ